MTLEELKEQQARAEMPPRVWRCSAKVDGYTSYEECAEAPVIISECEITPYVPEAALHAARKEAEDARAKAFEEIGDWLNVAHTSRPDLFPPFDNEAAWGGANHFKVYAANALWKMAEEIRAPAPSQPASGAGEEKP